MKLTYWIAVCLDDSEVYNIRAKTKKEVNEQLARVWGRYGKARKVEVEYSDSFDLLVQCTSEGRAYWERMTEEECKQ